MYLYTHLSVRVMDYRRFKAIDKYINGYQMLHVHPTHDCCLYYTYSNEAQARCSNFTPLEFTLTMIIQPNVNQNIREILNTS